MLADLLMQSVCFHILPFNEPAVDDLLLCCRRLSTMAALEKELVGFIRLQCLAADAMPCRAQLIDAGAALLQIRAAIASHSARKSCWIPTQAGDKSSS